MENIFTQRQCVISSFIVPWILGLGHKTPEQAKSYVKYGKTLEPSYYACGQRCINAGIDIYSIFMERLFNDKNIDYELTQIIGDNVYKPWDCLSGIYQIEINEIMGLVARPNGVTKNNECVVMVDNYNTKLNSNREEEINIKLLSTMSVWKAKKGIYIITKMKKNIYITFDNTKWEDILCKIRLWSEYTLKPTKNSQNQTQLSIELIIKNKEYQEREKPKLEKEERERSCSNKRKCNNTKITQFFSKINGIPE